MNRPAMPAPLDAVADYLSDLDDRMLLCRARGHRWDDYGRVIYDRKTKTYDETVTCERCGAERTTIYDREGDVIRRRTDYADGYLMPRGTGRVDRFGRRMMRREHLSRLRPIRRVSGAA